MDQIVTPPSVPAVPLPPAPVISHIVFAHERPVFRRLAMRGAVLEFFTLGFYRFWLATDLRRHLWSRTSIDGDSAEYLGTAKELLIGFLFAIAVLAPIYLVYFLLTIEAERLRTFGSMPLFALFYVLFQFAAYRARRYRLTRTVWRGVRFSMMGSGWGYALRASLWMLLSIVTLGLAMPWRQAALERYKMRHTSFGNLQGRFDGTGWQLFKRIWWLWLIPIALFLTILMLSVSVGPLRSPAVQILLSLIPTTFIGLLMPFIYGYYKSVEWRWWMSGLRMGDVAFSSEMGSNALTGLYWKVIGWTLLLFLVIGGGSALVMAMIRQAGGFPATQPLPVVVAGGLVYLAAALAFGVVVRIYLMHDVWRRVAETATVHNLAAAHDVIGQGQLAGALGEGLADSLDVAGF